MTASLNTLTMSQIKKIALLNFGGIGDEVLFSPVIQELRHYLPNAHMTLFLEDRSRSVEALLPGIDAFYDVPVQEMSRIELFFHLQKRLKADKFDLVVSSGSSPFIAPLLWLSGIPLRFGFQSKTSQLFLTKGAPLNLIGYAGNMYFSLAKTTLDYLLSAPYLPPEKVLPVLVKPDSDLLAWADQQLKKSRGRLTLLIHPGVSQVSVEKGIVKSWPPQDWANLVQILLAKERQLEVFLVGGPDDRITIEQILAELPKELPHFHNLYGKTCNLSQLAALISQTDLLLSVDSAPMHIAVGMDTPVIALFGELDPARLLPEDNYFIPLQQSEPNAALPQYLNISPKRVDQAIQRIVSTLSPDFSSSDKPIIQ